MSQSMISRSTISRSLHKPAVKCAMLRTGLLVSLIGGLVATQAQASTLPEAALAEFYHATNGDLWLRNDGWLDPQVDACDWYGITCSSPAAGIVVIDSLHLPGNNLSGSINGLGLLKQIKRSLDLGNNRLDGTLDRIRFNIALINLANNQFSGPLPALGQPDTITPSLAQSFEGISVLNLSGNEFEGSVPDDWRQFSLSVLDLSNNRLSGGLANAFAALRDSFPAELYVQDNRFTGSLPTNVRQYTLYETDQPMSGGGLNLCWNDWQIDDPDVLSWIDRHHVGGPGWQDCVGRSRQHLDAGVSGSWFSPQRAGEGISLMLLEDQSALLYGFSFNVPGEQQWFFEATLQHQPEHLAWPTLLETRGDFGQGLRMVSEQPLMREVAQIRLDRVGADRLHMERVFIDHSGCPPLEQILQPGDPIPMPCPVQPLSDRIDLVQLTRLAGSTCDRQIEHQSISGAWFNPAQVGEGLVIEVLADGRVVVYWFTYAADGSGKQVWLTGDGRIDGSILVIDNLYRPVGTVYGELFDAAEVRLERWGRLTLDILDNATLQARYVSTLADFGQGEFLLQQLARPLLAECDAGQ